MATPVLTNTTYQMETWSLKHTIIVLIFSPCLVFLHHLSEYMLESAFSFLNLPWGIVISFIPIFITSISILNDINKKEKKITKMGSCHAISDAYAGGGGRGQRFLYHIYFCAIMIRVENSVEADKKSHLWCAW